MRADITENEAKRLNVLRQCELLDTPAEEEFDSLVRLASLICETPIAFVSLVDEGRQWFRAKIGIEASETPRDQAFCAYTIQQPGMMIVPDATEDNRFAANPLVTGDPHIRFYAGVPLETSENVRLGSLCVIDRVPRELKAHQLQALELLTRQAQKMINLRLQHRMMADAVGLGELVSQELQKNCALFHAFMDNSPFVSYLKTRDGHLAYYNQPFANHFGIDRKEGLGKSNAELWPGEPGEKMSANENRVLREWKTLTTEEFQISPDGKASWWRSYRFPFSDSMRQEYVAGSMIDVTADKQAEFKLQSFQHALTEANNRLQALATTDPLTNLNNRRAFDAALRHEFELSRRYGHPLSLLILDIDNFKAFNDDFGHGEGDRVLQSVAAVLTAGLRAGDTVARYGGEEFAVILSHTGAEAALVYAERIRRGVADVRGRRAQTVSAGLASLNATWTQHDLIRYADEALYAAKRSGKNRVCLAETETAIAR